MLSELCPALHGMAHDPSAALLISPEFAACVRAEWAFRGDYWRNLTRMTSPVRVSRHDDFTAFTRSQALTTATTATASTRKWTVSEWSSFTARCREAREELVGLIVGLPETPGVTSATTGLLIKAECSCYAAMLDAEMLAVKQHPELGNADIAFAEARGPAHWAGARRGASRESRPLSRVEWASFAIRLVALRRVLLALGSEVGRTLGGKSASGKLMRAGEMSGIRFALDAAARSQHPGWEDAGSLFFVSRES